MNILSFHLLKLEIEEQNKQGKQQEGNNKDQISMKLGFPGGTVVKNPPANAGDTGSSPSPGRSHMPRSN